MIAGFFGRILRSSARLASEVVERLLLLLPLLLLLSSPVSTELVLVRFMFAAADGGTSSSGDIWSEARGPMLLSIAH